MDIVIARGRTPMWTAFATPSGRAVLNVDDEGGMVSILLKDSDLSAFTDPYASAGAVEELLRSGPRLSCPLATPPRSAYERMAA